MNDFETMMDDYPESRNYNVSPKIFFFMIIIPPNTKKLRRKLDYMAKIISAFIDNLGIKFLT